jgi:PAS domain S-box-containing protein
MFYRRPMTRSSTPPDPPNPPLTPLTSAILASAMDAVVIMDASGRVLYWNPAAENMFGIPETEVVGRDLADLVIPEALRPRHRAGLTRAAAGRRSAILGRRFEVTGLGAGGTIIPVELTVTSIERDGGTLFVGYLRDITERRRAIADLRASRHRLVTVSDEARRRLEHDLHDGAQQQLVAVAMAVAAARTALETDVPSARVLIEQAGDQLREAISGLRELARGLHPDVLARRGLPGAVADLVRRSGIVVVSGTIEPSRLPADVEIAAYYVLAESLTNAAKHGARQARVDVAVNHLDVSSRPVLDQERQLVLSVTDDGPGGADVNVGTGLRGLMDRWAAVGGELVVDSPVGRGTRITARLTLPASARATPRRD